MSDDPILFKRGTTFSFAMKVDPDIADATFLGWDVKAQVRKHKNDMESGLIAQIPCFWLDPKTTRFVGVFYSLTEKWPLGLIDMDIRFTSPNGVRICSKTITFLVERGITK